MEKGVNYFIDQLVGTEIITKLIFISSQLKPSDEDYNILHITVPELPHPGVVNILVNNWMGMFGFGQQPVKT
jgi:hypothetical protein